VQTLIKKKNIEKEYRKGNIKEEQENNSDNEWQDFYNALQANAFDIDDEGENKQEVWYYIKKTEKAPHALVYNPNSGIIYDVNHPNNGNDDGLISWLQGREKSISYKFNMKNSKDASLFWKFKGGRGILFLYPVVVTNPSAAESFFESQVGKEWDYNFFMNNCKYFSIQGLKRGGANINTNGPHPGVWYNSGASLVWRSGMPKSGTNSFDGTLFP